MKLYHLELGIRSKVLIMNLVLVLLMSAPLFYSYVQLQSIEDKISEQNQIVERLSRVITESDQVILNQNAAIKDLEVINNAIESFGTVREWYADLTTTSLMASEDKAEEAFEVMQTHLAAFKEREPEKVALIIEKVSLFGEKMGEATDAYADGIRVRGNKLTAEARVLADEATSLIQEIATPPQKHAEESIRLVLEHNQSLKKFGKSVRQAGEENFVQLETLIRISFLVSSGIFLLAMLISYLFASTLTKPIRIIVQAINEIAQGDLTKRIIVSSKDEIGKLAVEFNKFISHLQDSIAQTKESAHDIALSADQIATGNQNLASRTELQASSQEETAAAMEEMTATTQQNAENADQANNLSKRTKSLAESGAKNLQEVVEQTIEENLEILSNVRSNNQQVFEQIQVFNQELVRAMQDIKKSSTKISGIITVINDIAFQTNLLALNASVEAARAGEHGRGFAVVAAEVRKLAHRSAKASKKIGQLIDESLRQVNHGTGLTEQSKQTLQQMLTDAEAILDTLETTSEKKLRDLGGQVEVNLTQIIDAVAEVAEMFENISAASSEQAHGIGQVNVALGEMDQVTQQNAALVEETATSSQEMVEKARDMIDFMSLFIVSEEKGTTLEQSTSRPPEITKSSGNIPLASRESLSPRNQEEVLPDFE